MNPNNWTLKVTCKGNFVKEGCNTEFQIYANDIKIRYYDREDDDYYVVCPICKEMIVLNKDLLPGVIKNHARNKKEPKAEQEYEYGR